MTIYEYLRNLFMACSQAINAVIGGDPQESLSARCYRLSWRTPMSVINTVAAWFGQPHHCRGAYHALRTWAQDKAKTWPQDVPESDTWR